METGIMQNARQRDYAHGFEDGYNAGRLVHVAFGTMAGLALALLLRTAGL